MTNYITDLFTQEIWEYIFSTAFFLGLLFTLYIILAASMGGHTEHDTDSGDVGADSDIHTDLSHDIHADLSHDIHPDLSHDIHTDLSHDMDTDLSHDIDTDLSHDMDLTHDIDTDLSADHDFSADLDADSDLSLDHDMDLDADGHIDLSADHDSTLHIDHDMNLDHDLDLDGDYDLSLDPDLVDVEISDLHDTQIMRNRDSHELKSKFTMGNFSMFFLFFGQVGWLWIDNLSDFLLVAAVIAGTIASKLFAYVITNYAKTVVVPLVRIQQGDIAEIQYSVTPTKPGLVNVFKRDGTVDPVIARGVFPHDNLHKGDRVYVVGKKDSIYLVTRGTAELKKKIIKKKGLAKLSKTSEM